MTLGKKVTPEPAKEPEPEWRFHKPGFEIDQKGRLRTTRSIFVDLYMASLAKKAAP